MFYAERGEWNLMANMRQLDAAVAGGEEFCGQPLFSSGDCLNPWKGHMEA